MKTLILSMTLLAMMAQADVVHYDDRDKEKPQTTKPNHPHADLYTK